MPRLSEAKKDVPSCEKPRGPARGLDPRMSEWGNPPAVMWVFRKGRRTWGTETSKYPQEEKTTVIP
jgi:hypothetical protein